MSEQKKKIRVLVVDDSEFQRGFISGILGLDPEIEVVGHAHNGLDAVEKVLSLKPDIVTMDINMPVMDGLEATNQIMSKCATPILVVSTTIQDEEKFAFNCLKLGALDFVGITTEHGIDPDDLLTKVKMCSRIKVVTHPKIRSSRLSKISSENKGTYDVVGIAVSTGGPPALQQVLTSIPKNFPLPVVIVQHISEGFTQSLADWLNEKSNINVVVAKDGEMLSGGNIYLAPDGDHLIINEDKKFKVLKGVNYPKIYHKPSGDVMLTSLAKVFGAKVIGVIMTGMGRDGAAGIAEIKKAGGFTIAQDEETSIIYGMNKTAIDEGNITKILPVEQIGSALAEILK